ncbi:hypothetical protein [Haloterrigena turkmenica]|uniref:hypothetical protein n=1 Tax=Haloterrigena turkmenica TaxID=62320 RepID=UPI0006782C9D|nr:hypothetical protein [Haloterrigena turkmenica]
MTSDQDQTSGGARTYTDEQFLEWIPEERSQHIATSLIKRRVECTFNTVNRRVAALADEEGTDCVDLESKEVVSPETVDGSSRPMFGFGNALAEVLEE